MTKTDELLREKIRKILTIDRGVVYGDFPGLIADLELLFNQEVEKRIAEIDKYGRLSIAVIKKKLWSMRFDEDDVKNETDNERKQYIYGYTEAINHMVEYLMDMASLCNCSRMTSSEKPNNSQKTEGGAK